MNALLGLVYLTLDIGLIDCFVALRPKSTAMVMARRQFT